MYRPEGYRERATKVLMAYENEKDDTVAWDNLIEGIADAMQVCILAKLLHIMRPIHTLLQREELLNNLVSQLRG